MTKPILYGIILSPPVRAVLLVAKHLEIELEFKEINFVNGDTRKPEYLKMNPQHSVPTLDDNGFYLWDSHAIIVYLVNKYGKDETLYPKDLKKRAIVDQRLYFDSGILFPRLTAMTIPLFFQGKTTIEEDKKLSVAEAYNFLEIFLEKYQWVAGDDLTIADLSLVTTITSLKGFVSLNENDHKQIINWLNKMQELPYYAEINQNGLDMGREVVKKIMGNNINF